MGNIQRVQEQTARFREKGKGRGHDPRDIRSQPHHSQPSGYDPLRAVAEHTQALATATYLNSVMQQSYASAYGGQTAVGQPPPQPGQPGSTGFGFGFAPPAGQPGSAGFGFGYSI